MEYLFNGTDDFFAAAAVALQSPQPALFRREEEQLDLFGAARPWPAAAGLRLQQSIEESYGSDLLCALTFALCDAKDASSALFSLLRRIIAEGPQVWGDSGDPACLQARQSARRAAGEFHKYCGICRFEPYQPLATRLAIIQPKADVIKQLAAFFASRLPDCDWALYDAGRRLLCRYASGSQSLTLLRGQLPTIQPLDQTALDFAHYFRLSSIESRISKKRQNRCLPQNLRLFMSEFLA